MARRRQHAREAGLCARCCKTRPSSGFVTCVPCNASALVRSNRKRKRDREAAHLRQIVAAHEAAGDRSQTHHLFDDAAQHYHEALNVTVIAPDDRLRLVEKLGSASLLSENPNAATPWRDRMLDAYLGDSGTAEKAIETLLQTARQRWIDSKTPDGVPICVRAIRIAEVHGLDRLRKVATLRLVPHLIVLDRLDDAIHYLDNLGRIDSHDDLSVRISYHREKGAVAALRGAATEAYANFEKAAYLVNKDTDLYRITSLLGDYALSAITLGNIERGKALYEQALLIVRRNHMGWLVPQLCMGYADILARMGQYSAAHGYLLEALSSDTHVPIVEERFAATGIPIALHLHDEAMLMKCIRPAAIDLAFQSHQSARIGSVSAAFAQLYAVQGQKRKSRALLHRALKIVNFPDEFNELPLAIAQYGELTDATRARALFEARLHLPSAHVAEACAALFDAFVARRMQERERTQQMATEAAERFDRLHWYAYGDLARSLIPLTRPISATSGEAYKKPLAGSLVTLTEREQQVVELVLKGLTNRTVAEKLSISENTVEKHMNSIMRRLDIRSRHQLVDRVAGLESKVTADELEDRP